jgi:hypothetical protein
MADVIKVSDLKKEDVPEKMRSEYYFDFKAHPFAHQALFERDDVNSVIDAIVKIDDYAKEWLAARIPEKIKENGETLEVWKGQAPEGVNVVGNFEVYVEKGALFMPSNIFGAIKGDEIHTLYVSKGTRIFGSDIYLDEGDIFVGEDNIIEPAVGIKGPTIIGSSNEIRQGTYFRGDVILGNDGTYRGELKNAVMMDKANFPHPSYVGDSICGYFTHFGNQATAANLGIFEGLKEKKKRKNLVFAIGDKRYDIGRPKMGVVMGDFSQVGCSSVADPGTFLGPYTIAYELTRLTKGFYGPKEVLKNKPMEHGIIERVPMKSLE